MAKKTIKFELSQSSIQRAIKEVEAYKESINRKTKDLVECLAQVGVNTISATMLSVASEDRGNYDTDWLWSADGSDVVGAVVYLKGDQVLFLEFSAGIRYGTNSFNGLPNNPSYGQGYGMGTYPGKGHWDEARGWWYETSPGSKEYIHTYGVKAYAPVYHADLDMRSRISSLAKEIFGS